MIDQEFVASAGKVAHDRASFVARPTDATQTANFEPTSVSMFSSSVSMSSRKISVSPVGAAVALTLLLLFVELQSFASSASSEGAQDPSSSTSDLEDCDTTSAKPEISSTRPFSAAQTTHRLSGSQVKRRRPAKALYESIRCGRVPVFEKQIHQSINESFMVNTGDRDDVDGYSEGQFRVLHGLDALSGEWPWISKIEMCNEYGEGCGSCTGSLINSRWIITAGHCGQGNIAYYRAKLGLYDLLVNDKTTIIVTFDKKIVHPKYTRKYDNDLTLFRLSKPVEFNDYVQPVCLVDKRHGDAVEFTRSRKCYNVGYGVTAGMSAALKLQKIQIEAKEPSECNDSRSFSVHLRKNDVCMGPRNEQIGASCRGDSGGPNTCYDPHTNQWYLFSTVSYGPFECDREQGDKWLTVSVDLSKYIGWIKRTIKDNS